MRVAIVGAGGIGCIYGASLAKAGAEVVFLARGAHLAALRANGLRIEGGRGETHIDPVQATDDPASVGIVDYAIFCVKLWDVESAGAAIKPLVGRETAVIPQQNGVDAHERLIPILGREAVMGGTAWVTGSIVAPGVVRQTGAYQRLIFGELDGTRDSVDGHAGDGEPDYSGRHGQLLFRHNGHPYAAGHRLGDCRCRWRVPGDDYDDGVAGRHDECRRE